MYAGAPSICGSMAAVRCAGRGARSRLRPVRHAANWGPAPSIAGWMMPAGVSCRRCPGLADVSSSGQPGADSLSLLRACQRGSERKHRYRRPGHSPLALAVVPPGRRAISIRWPSERPAFAHAWPTLNGKQGSTARVMPSPVPYYDFHPHSQRNRVRAWCTDWYIRAAIAGSTG